MGFGAIIGDRAQVASLLASVVAATLLAAPAAEAGSVKSCASAVVLRASDYRYEATDIRRSSTVSCRFALNLLRAAYGRGPLDRVATSYMRNGEGERYGRPTYSLRGGWRCTNGAGGASCWSATQGRHNAVRLAGVKRRFTVVADVGYLSGRS